MAKTKRQQLEELIKSKNPNANVIDVFSKLETIKGDKGDQGERGYTPIKGKDYFTDIEISNIIAYIQSRVKDGEKGDKGDKGDSINGKDGKTPIRGVDYWTEKDQEKILKDILKQIPKPTKEKPIDINELVSKVQEKIPQVNYKEEIGKILNTPGFRMLMHGGGLSTVAVDGVTITGNGTPSSPLVAVGGGGSGTVDSVVAGTGISVNSTDPANPIVTNTEPNATHTGEVTGATTLTVDKTAITGKTLATAVGTDYVLISDTSDTGNLKKALVSDIMGSGSVAWGSITGTLSSQTDLQTVLDGKVTYTGATTDLDLNAKSFKNFFISKTADTTAKMVFDVSGLSTATTRTLTVPNRSLTIDNITTSTTTNGTGFLKGNGSVISFDNSTYLTSVGTGVANEITYWSGTNTLGSLTTATYPSLTELSYVKGVTSAIQTQLNGKQATLTPAALTKTDDTNVTLTLGGTPTTALLQATSLTLGWAGQLGLSRGGTGANLSDPGANKIMAWDDTDNSVGFWTLGSNLSYDHATHTLSAAGGSGSPGSPSNSIQFNNTGSFAGSKLLYTEPDTITANIQVENQTDSDSDGTTLNFLGSAPTNGYGGGFSFTSADGTTTFGGGGFSVVAGNGGVTSGDGGSINLTAGSAQGGNSDGGDVILVAGAASGSGAEGKFYMGTNSSGGALYIDDTTFSMNVTTGLYTMYNPAGTYIADLDTSLIDTTSKTFTFPNASGTFMLTSAIGTTVQAYDADLTTWAGITPGTGVGTALAVNVGTAGAFIRNGDTITLAENTSIALDPAGSADGKWTGVTITATAGYAQTFGDLVYLDPTDSRWEKADANSASGADGDARGILGMVVVAGAADGSACTILLNGVIRADAAFPAFTINNPIYVSETAGAVTQTQPTTTDVVIRVIGSALTADEMYFNPDRIWFTHI